MLSASAAAQLFALYIDVSERKTTVYTSTVYRSTRINSAVFVAHGSTNLLLIYSANLQLETADG